MLGAVVYTDGGALVNPGPAGSGFHGYIYEFKHPKKGTGNSKLVLTQHGYYDIDEFLLSNTGKNGKKKDLQEKIKTIPDEPDEEFIEKAYSLPLPYEVTPIKYLDGFRGFGRVTTNNQAELIATLQAIRLLLSEKESLRRITVISDSKYVVKCYNEYLDQWKASNFIKKDGQEVLNKDLWIGMLDIREEARSKGIQLALEWIKGHDGQYGNERADHYATMGINLSLNSCLLYRSDEYLFNFSDAQGYWKADIEKPSLFFNKYVVFNTGNISDQNTFFSCTTLQDINFLGSAEADAGFSLIQLNDGFVDENIDPLDSDVMSDHEGITIIKDIMKMQAKLLDNHPFIVTIPTDVAFNKDFISDYRLGGMDSLSICSDYRREIATADRPSLRKNLTNVINPPYISWRVEDVLSRLEDILIKYQENSNLVVATDITELLYEKVIKKTKSEEVTLYQLRSKFKVGYEREVITVKYNTLENDEIDEVKIVLKFGQDLPDRNTLKRLEKDIISVNVLTLALANRVITYGVRILTKKGSILSTGYFSSLTIIKGSREEERGEK